VIDKQIFKCIEVFFNLHPLNRQWGLHFYVVLQSVNIFNFGKYSVLE